MCHVQPEPKFEKAWLATNDEIQKSKMPVLIALSVVLMTFLGGCASQDRDEFAQSITAGNPANGRRLLYSYTCGSCHIIPGVREADGTIGPPLRGFANRVYIAGVLQNTPDNLFR